MSNEKPNCPDIFLNDVLIKALKEEDQVKKFLNDEDPTDPPSQPAEISEIIDGGGRWQHTIFVFMFFAIIPSVWSNFQITFVAPNVDFRCSRSNQDGSRHPSEFVNSSRHNFDVIGGSKHPDELVSGSRHPFEVFNVSRPTHKGLIRDDRCYVAKLRNGTDGEGDRRPLVFEPCVSWDYETGEYPSTIVSKWDLVCDRGWLVSLTKSIYNIGILVGVAIFGQLSDVTGRRPALLLAYVLASLSGLISVFSWSLEMYVILRVLSAMGGGSFYTIGFVILTEMVSPKHRTLVGIAINFGWCLGLVLLPLIAYYIRHRFWLELAINLSRLLFIPVFWLIPESYRWLLAKNRTDAFRRVVLKAAKANGKNEVTVHREIEKFIIKHEVIESSKIETKATVLDLLKTPNLRIFTLVVIYNWFVNSFVYFGLSYNVGELSSNIYLDFFLFAVVEFPAYLFAYLVIRRMGRRIPLTLLMIITGVACLASIPVPPALPLLKTFFPLVGKFCISMTFAIIYIYSVEIFPTIVRNAGLAAGTTCSAIGSIAAPFVRELAHNTFPCFPDILYAFLTISSGLLILLLPETHNKPMSDTINQAENFKKNSKKSKFYLPCEQEEQL